MNSGGLRGYSLSTNTDYGAGACDKPFYREVISGSAMKPGSPAQFSKFLTNLNLYFYF